MERAFVTVLNMSITAGYVILAILLLRMLLRRAPKKYACGLWAAAAFRLVCPVSFASVWSLFTLGIFDVTQAQQAGETLMTYVPQDIGMAAQPAVSVGLPAVNAVLNEALPAATPHYSANPMQIWMSVAACVWVVGMIVLAVYGVVSYAALYLRMRSAVRMEGNVYCSERVRSPFILDILRPRIYIPYGLSDDASACVLAHERFHLRHFDHVIKPLAFCIAAVHWFNPLVWIALSRFGHDLEMRTDEAVLSEGADIRKAYSTVLLSFASNKRFPMPKPLAFGESGVRIRIQNALRWRKPKKSMTIVCICITLAVLVACAANPELPETPQPDAEVSTGAYLTGKHLLTTGDAPLDDDSGCIYDIGEDFFLCFDRESGEVISLSSGPGGFQWIEPERSVEAMMKVFASANVEPLDRDYTGMTVCPMGLDDGLARVEDELWLILMEDNVLTDIYTLVPTERTPENYGFNYIEWSYNPIYSSQLPALRFGCDIEYESLTATCEAGTIISFDAHGRTEGYPGGKTLTVPFGEAIYWAPTDGDGTTVAEDTVEITVTLPSGAEVTGTLTITGSRVLPDEPDVRMKYHATLTSDDLFLRADYENGGGVLKPIEHHLSVFDYPHVN